jgi:hypothetical protein
MDVDVEPLESQAYRRSKEAAHHQADPPPFIAETLSTTTSSTSSQDHHSHLDEPVKRRKSDRARHPAVATHSPSSTAQRLPVVEDEMAYPGGFPVALSSPASASGSSRRSGRNPDEPAEIPVKYTPVTGRISRAKKGVPVHICDQCPGKVFTRAEHLR